MSLNQKNEDTGILGSVLAAWRKSPVFPHSNGNQFVKQRHDSKPNWLGEESARGNVRRGRAHGDGLVLELLKHGPPCLHVC